MPLLSLEDEVRSDIAHVLEGSRPFFFRFSFEEVKAGHRPGWPLAYSFILHELAIVAIVLLSIVASGFHPIQEAESFRLNPTDHRRRSSFYCCQPLPSDKRRGEPEAEPDRPRHLSSCARRRIGRKRT